MPETKDTKEEKPGNLPDAVTKVLEDLKTKVEGLTPKEEPPPSPSAPSYADQRAALQKRLGFNDDQMSAHEEMIMKANAPAVEQTAWARLEKKSDLENYRAEMEKELAIYPQERRTPEIMEKIYYFVKGKHADSKPADTKPGPGSRVVDTKVSRGPGYTGSDPGLSGGGRGGEGSGGEEEQLSDQEKFVAAKLGVTEKDYRDSKKVGRSIRELRVPDARPVNSLADVELKRMQTSR